MAPLFVKGYVKSNQNDYKNAGTIREAVRWVTMRFVAVETVEPQDLQVLHRIRQAPVKIRTALDVGRVWCSNTRGSGPDAAGGLELLEAGENRLSAMVRSLLVQLYEQLLALDARIRGCGSAECRVQAAGGVPTLGGG